MNVLQYNVDANVVIGDRDVIQYSSAVNTVVGTKVRRPPGAGCVINGRTSGAAPRPG